MSAQSRLIIVDQGTLGIQFEGRKCQQDWIWVMRDLTPLSPFFPPPPRSILRTIGLTLYSPLQPALLCCASFTTDKALIQGHMEMNAFTT